MGYIEDYWDDITIYYVEFIGQCHNNISRKHGKFIAFRSGIHQEDVPDLVKEHLKGVNEVIAVDEISIALLLKNELPKS